jgi:sigma-B regulation protein RsbU (phosphoserine phosphatase)
MVERLYLVPIVFGALAATVIWGRSALRVHRMSRRIAAGQSTEAAALAWSSFRKELHTAIVYGIATVSLALAAVWTHPAVELPLLLLVVPIAMTLTYGQRFLEEAALIEQRAALERRAEEALSQQELAPRRWATRLAPEDLPEFPGFEVGRVYEAGSGLMAGDFYDLFQTAPNRLAAVIGDVSGHGIDASITAFQVKYLLRVFLRQYRDPAQAVEELNAVLSAQNRGDEFVSLCVTVFDENAGTLRFSSAGHPPAWLWHDGELRPLRATGPLLTLDPGGEYTSFEVPLETGDLLLLYTDGLSEARAGEQLFGEERIANAVRRDPGMSADTLCKSLLEAARDFATAPLGDDVAILAIRRT